MNSDFPTKNFIIGVTVCVVIMVAVYFIQKYKPQKSKEKFGIALGMLAPQRRFYDKCTGDCYRNFTGDSSEGQFLWLCNDYCEEKAMARVALGLPDLTEDQHERHSYCQTDFINASNISFDGIVGGGLPIVKQQLKSPDECYCLDDTVVYCREQICPHSKNPKQCLKDCFRTRAVQCKSGMFGGWKP